jgi:hypothetical protein
LTLADLGAAVGCSRGVDGPPIQVLEGLQMDSAEVLERSFVRHPVDIPISIDAEGLPPGGSRRVKDVGLGGLACRSEHPLQVGSTVVLTIPLVTPPFRAAASVVWCRGDGPDYEVGVRFREADDAFAARLVEQICQIEHYRREVLHVEGRVLDAESAAAEWIGRYAAQFAAMGSNVRQ